MRWAFPFIVGAAIGYLLTNPQGQHITKSIFNIPDKAIKDVVVAVKAARAEKKDEVEDAPGADASGQFA